MSNKDNQDSSNSKKMQLKSENSKSLQTTLQESQQSSMNALMLQKINSANQQLLHSQSTLIKSLYTQIYTLQAQLKAEQQKYTNLQNILTSLNKKSQKSEVQQLKGRITQLEVELTETKIQLAIKNSQSLEKDLVIKQVVNKNKLLDEELQKISTFSQTDNTSMNQEKNPKSINNDFEPVQINKDNIQEYIPAAENNQSTFDSIRSILQRQLFKKSTSNQTATILKLWQKQVQQHILPKSKSITFTSKIKKQAHLQKFLKQTLPLLKKYYGIPHVYRHKIWVFVSNDKLALSNALYLQLLDRRNRGWVSEKIKLQIEKDMNRSFNGQGSKQKLMRIHQIALGRVKSQSQKEPQIKDFARKNSFDQHCHEQEAEVTERSRTQSFSMEMNKFKDSPEVDKSQQKNPTDFKIAEDVTEVLEVFYIYRPDIGFVQGMTYPTIVLTLVVGKLPAFRILCNLLLCNDFFKKMITFEANFINYFCRIFDELLLSHNLTLYNRLFKQFEIKSEVFLVDWFFTFFSRGISPQTILRIWDLFLYHCCTNPKTPQIILYKLSLTIFDLIEPILLQTNYEECIRTIREYSRKIDEQQLINKLYDSFKDSSMVQKFEEKYVRVKLRVEKKYVIEHEEV